MNSLCARLSLLLACGALTACSSQGALLLEVSTDLKVPAAGATLDIGIAQAGNPIFKISFEVDGTPDEGGLALPATLMIFAKDSEPPGKGSIAPGVLPLQLEGPLRIEISMTKGDNVELERSATLDLPSSEVKALRLKLESACLGIACGSGETCLAGKCAPAAVDAESLPNL